MRKSVGRRLLIVLSAWMLAVGLACLSQAQVPMTGAGKGAPSSSGGGAVTWDTGHAFNITFTNVNLTITNTSVPSAFGNTRSTTSHTSGKYYLEHTVDADDGLSAMGVGVCNGSFTFSGQGVGLNNNSTAYYDSAATFLNSVDTGTTNISYTTADIIREAVDIDNQRIWWSRRRSGVDGPWNTGVGGTPNPITNTGGLDISVLGATLYLCAEVETSGEQFTTNFGATSFVGAVPTAFVPW